MGVSAIFKNEIMTIITMMDRSAEAMLIHFLFPYRFVARLAVIFHISVSGF